MEKFLLNGVNLYIVSIILFAPQKPKNIFCLFMDSESVEEFADQRPPLTLDELEQVHHHSHFFLASFRAGIIQAFRSVERVHLLPGDYRL